MPSFFKLCPGTRKVYILIFEHFSFFLLFIFSLRRLLQLAITHEQKKDKFKKRKKKSKKMKNVQKLDESKSLFISLKLEVTIFLIQGRSSALPLC